MERTRTKASKAFQGCRRVLMVPLAMKRMRSSMVKKKRTTDCGRAVIWVCYKQQTVVRRWYRDACLYQRISSITVLFALWHHKFEHESAYNVGQNAANLKIQKVSEPLNRKIIGARL
jgi:hypothetical protein